jgi:hypothetical protein
MCPAAPATPLPLALPEPPAWLQVGALDQVATRQLRLLLGHLVARPGSALVVDLADLDAGHELTVFALLSQSGQDLAATGGSLLVVDPPQSLAAMLVSADIRVARGPRPAKPAGSLTLEVGHRPSAEGHA